MSSNWIDGTNVLNQGCVTLSIGKMLLAKDYSLHDAMVALEMMDPKMDAGMLLPEHLEADRAVVQFQSKVTHSVTWQETIAIMDRLLLRVFSWIQGQPLTQTILTSLYLHMPLKRIHCPVLKSYCEAILQWTLWIRSVVAQANVIHDEDFSSLSGKFEFGPMLQKEALQSLKENHLRAIEVVLVQREADDLTAKAIRSRVQLVHTWIDLCVCFRTGSIQRQVIESKLETMKRLSQQWQETMNGTETFDDVQLGFNAHLMRTSVSHFPPRDITLLTLDETLNEMRSTLETIKHIVALNCENMTHSLLQIFMDQIARKSSNVLSRSFHFLHFYSNRLVFGHVTMTDFLYRDLEQFICGGLSPTSVSLTLPRQNSAQVHPVLLSFLSCLSQTALEVYRMRCFNVSRQRRRLVHLLIEWDALQMDAEDLDVLVENNEKSKRTTKEPFWISTWIHCCKLQLMADYLMQGFDLELYACTEYASVYWYVDYIFGGFLSNGQRLLQSLEARKTTSPSLTLTLQWITVQLHLARAYFRALVGFENDSRFEWFDSRFRSGKALFKQTLEQQRLLFEHRMKPLRRCQTPHPLTFDQYLESQRKPNDVDVDAFYLAAMDDFQYVRQEAAILLQQCDAWPLSSRERVEHWRQVATTNWLVLQKEFKSPVSRVNRAHPKQRFLVHLNRSHSTALDGLRWPQIQITSE